MRWTNSRVHSGVAIALTILLLGGCLPHSIGGTGATRVFGDQTSIASQLLPTSHASGANGISLASTAPVMKPMPTAMPLAAPIISNNGANTIFGIVTAPAAVVSHNGANVVSHNGANIVSNNGGGVISTNGGSVISTNGGSVISTNGGNIVSNNGGGLISNNGGNLGQIAADPASLQISPVPLAGVTVTLEDAAGTPVKDGSGNPLITTTDATGHYSFPESVQGRNLVVHASLPGQSGDLVALLPKDGTGQAPVNVNMTSTLTLSYVLSQYVNGNLNTFEKLPADIASQAAAEVSQAILNNNIALPSTLDIPSLVATLNQIRQADQTTNKTFDQIKQILVIVGVLNEGDGLPSDQVYLGQVAGLLGDPQGNIYIFSCSQHTLWKRTSDGILHTIVAFGNWGYPDQQIVRDLPSYNSGMAFSADGSIVLADTYYNRVVRITSDAAVVTIAGTGQAGFSGDGGDAKFAQLNHPSGIAIDSLNRIYVSDADNHRVRQIALDGTISTFAGGGLSGFGGDAGPAKVAQLKQPQGLAFDRSAALLIADVGDASGEDGLLRKVDPDGTISTLYGQSQKLAMPGIVVVSGNGDIYLECQWAGKIFRLDSVTMNATDVVDNGLLEGSTGYGVSFPLAMTLVNDQLVFDNGTSQIFSETSGVFKHIAGQQSAAQATVRSFQNANRLWADKSETIYVADTNACGIYKVQSDGSATRIAGDGTQNFVGSAPQSSNAPISLPFGLCIDNGGDIVFTDIGNHPAVECIAPSGQLSTIAGNGVADFADIPLGPALSVSLANPYDVVQMPDGSYCFSESDENRIMHLTNSGNLELYVPVASCFYPTALVVGPDKNLTFVQRRGTAIVSVVNGSLVSLVDIGQIQQFFTIGDVQSIAFDAMGRLYIASSNKIVRWLQGSAPVLVAGVGAPSLLNGKTQDSGLSAITGITFGPSGALYILDSGQLKRLTASQLDSQ